MTPPDSSAKRLLRARSSPKAVKQLLTTEARYRMLCTSSPCSHKSQHPGRDNLGHPLTSRHLLNNAIRSMQVSLPCHASTPTEHMPTKQGLVHKHLAIDRSYDGTQVVLRRDCSTHPGVQSQHPDGTQQQLPFPNLARSASRGLAGSKEERQVKATQYVAQWQCKQARQADLSHRVICNLALVQGVHQSQHPGHVEGQLLGEEVISNRVQPLDVGHMPQVGRQPVKVGSHGAPLPWPAPKEGYGLCMCAKPRVHIPA